jgi:hypothetical protein
MTLQRSAWRAVALTVLALALPTAARADHGKPLLHDRLGTYFGIAQAHWGGPVPSCVANGVTVIPVHAVLYDDPDPDVAARADQPGCRLWLDRGHWRTMGRVEACTVVVHEWGHLLGFGHSGDPLSVMAAFPAQRPRRCAALEPRRRVASAAVRASCAGRATRPPAHRKACARRLSSHSNAR